MRLNLFQHAWSASDLDPDGAAYATKPEAEAAAADNARELLGEDYSGDDLADAILEHTSADDVGEARIAEIRLGGRMTDAEAIMAAEGLRRYESAIYPVSVTFKAEDLLRQIVGESASPGHQVSAAGLLEVGAAFARRAVEVWSSGDLAGAINALESWAEDVESAFPGLDCTDEDEDAADGIPDPVGMSVLDICPGDRVDLEGAPGWTDPSAEFEYAICTGTERETVDCVRLDFEGLPSLGIDASASLPVVKREHFPDAAAWATEAQAEAATREAAMIRRATKAEE